MPGVIISVLLYTMFDVARIRRNSRSERVANPRSEVSLPYPGYKYNESLRRIHSGAERERWQRPARVSAVAVVWAPQAPQEPQAALRHACMQVVKSTMLFIRYIGTQKSPTRAGSDIRESHESDRTNTFGSADSR